MTDQARRKALAEIDVRAWDTYRVMPRTQYADMEHASQQPGVYSSAQYLADHMADVPALAYPKAGKFMQAYREPADRFIHWDTW